MNLDTIEEQQAKRMNNYEIQDLLSKKDEEMAEKKRITLEIFELIIDDCVN